MTNDPDQAQPGDTATPPRGGGRRRFIGMLAASAGSLAAGLAGGVVAGQASAPPATKIDGPKRFAGKVVLVTGGTSGIGRATALAFSAAGAQVVLCGRREALGNEVAGLARADGGQAEFVRTDVREAAQVKRLMSHIQQRYGRLDVAFNNAGVYANHPFHEMPLETFDNLQATNVRGTFLCMREQLPIMLAQGAGSIIVTSSVQEFATRPGSVAYVASKRAVVGLVKVAALEYGSRGIRVNALCPGTINTPMVRTGAAAHLPDAAWALAAAAWGQRNVHGIGRMGTAEEMARTVLWIASDEMSYLNGAAIAVDGGMTTAL